MSFTECSYYCVCSIELKEDRHFDVLSKVIISVVPHKWNNIGTYLGLSYTKLQAIKAASSENSDRLSDVFGQWLRGDKGTGKEPRTVQTVYDALVDSECRPEADSLVKKLTERFRHKDSHLSTEDTLPVSL